MAQPRKQVRKAFDPITQARDEALNSEWFQRAAKRLRGLAGGPDTPEAADKALDIWRSVLEGIREEHPDVWSQYGYNGLLNLLGAELGHEPEPEKVRRLYPDVDATPYEVTEENVERVREAVRPGQLWVHVRGPRIDKLGGYIEWRLRELKERGFDVVIGEAGRPAKLTDDVCIEAVRLKDDEGWTYKAIGEKFGWRLWLDPWGEPRRCRTAERAVKRGRELLRQKYSR